MSLDDVTRLVECIRLASELTAQRDSLRAEVERLTKERDEAKTQAESYRKQGEADWNACCDVLMWARRFPTDSPPPSRAVVAVIDRLKELEAERVSPPYKFDGDSILREHAEEVLVSVAKAAARLGAEDMRKKAVEVCRARVMQAIAKKNKYSAFGDKEAERAWFYDQTAAESLASAIACLPAEESKP